MKMNEISRRNFVKISLSGAVAASMGVSCKRDFRREESKKLSIKIAGYAYDRVRAIMDGDVGTKDLNVRFYKEDIYSLNQYAFGAEPKYDVTEIGLIPYINKYINEGFRGYSLIPVFISRTFRHRNIFVRNDSGIKTPEDLRGKRVGTPGYGMSANTWIRGFLLDDYGIKAEEIQWIETQLSSDKGKGKNSGWKSFGDGNSKYFLPADSPLTEGPAGVDESELLLNGGCDALITAVAPKAFKEGNAMVRCLFSDVRAEE